MHYQISVILRRPFLKPTITCGVAVNHQVRRKRHPAAAVTSRIGNPSSIKHQSVRLCTAG